jgi:excisionase family DNA binding protein
LLSGYLFAHSVGGRAMVQKLYRVPEAAEVLALRPSTVRKLILQRGIAVCRPTKRAVRIPQSEIDRILRDGMTPRRERAAQA